MAPTTIETYQQTRCNYKNVSAAMPLTIYETAIRCAELQGYESVSAFVRDAVLDKVIATKFLREDVLEAGVDSVDKTPDIFFSSHQSWSEVALWKDL